MDDLTKCTDGELILDLMMKSLRVDNAQLNALATELCGRLGGKIARRLVLHAASRKNALNYRLRLLGALRNIKDGFDPESFFDLGILHASDKNPQIRAATAAVLRGLPRSQASEDAWET